MTDTEGMSADGPLAESSPGGPGPTDHARVGQGLAQRRQIIERVHDRFYDRLYRHCVHRLYHRETAEDIVSTAFVALAQNIGKLDGAGEEGLGRWLFRVANNAINSHFRQSKRRGEILANFGKERAGGPGVLAGGSERLDWPVVHAAVARLKPDQQNVVVLRFFEGLGLEEIALLTGKRPGTVRVILSRAMRKLSGCLEHLLGEE